MKKILGVWIAIMLAAALTCGALAEDVVSAAVDLIVPEAEGALPEAGNEAGEYADFVDEVAVSSVERDSDTSLYVYKEGLTTLDGLGDLSNLVYFGCSDNKLTSLDTANMPDLENLWCENNRLTRLNVSKSSKLEQLNCAGNRLTSLDLSKNTELRYLWCCSNRLTSLVLGNCTALKELYCYDNQLATLDLTKCKSLAAAVAKGKKKQNGDGSIFFEYYEEDDEGDERLLIVAIDQATTVTANGKVIYGVKPKSIAGAKVTVARQNYTGAKLTPRVTVKLDGKTLVKGTDYTVTYANNQNPGTATATVSGVGKYTGTAKASFGIVLGKPTRLTLTAGVRKLTATWKAARAVDGYQIEYSRSSTFSSPGKVTVEGAGTVSKALTGLRSNRTYHVRVRSYKKIGAKTWYSHWVRLSKKTK